MSANKFDPFALADDYPQKTLIADYLASKEAHDAAQES